MSDLEQADLFPRLEFDEDVDVARRCEIITKDRSEEGVARFYCELTENDILF